MLGAAWIAIKAWGLWSRIGSGLSALGGVAMRNPWPALAIVLLIGNGVQLAIHKRDLTRLKAIDTAQRQAVAIEKTDNAGAVSAVVKLNGQTDHDYQDGLAQGEAKLAAYVAAHRSSSAVWMRPADPAGQSSAAATDHAAPRAADPAAAPTVAFTKQQLKGWDEDYQAAVTCQTWAAHVANLFDGKHWPTPDEVAAVPAPAEGH